ncbi:hypothetical protein KCU76_g58, partial [Aureobasidium melanogenum]
MSPLLLLLLGLLLKFPTAFSIEYIFNYLCTDYVAHLVEFVEAYIHVVDVVRYQPHRERLQRERQTRP